MKENKNIVLHPDRVVLAQKLKDLNCPMLAYGVETGLFLCGFNMSQAEYDEHVKIAKEDI